MKKETLLTLENLQITPSHHLWLIVQARNLLFQSKLSVVIFSEISGNQWNHLRWGIISTIA